MNNGIFNVYNFCILSV